MCSLSGNDQNGGGFDHMDRFKEGQQTSNKPMSELH